MEKYIIRLTAQDYAFNGFRVSITRNKHLFVRYFSDLELGGQDAAYRQATALRDALLLDLQKHPDEVEAIFDRYRKPATNLPPGLHLQHRKTTSTPMTCTLRCSPP